MAKFTTSQENRAESLILASETLDASELAYTFEQLMFDGRGWLSRVCESVWFLSGRGDTAGWVTRVMAGDCRCVSPVHGCGSRGCVHR